MVRNGLFVGRLADHSNPESILGSVAGESSDYFSIMSDAFVGDAVVIDVPAGMVIEKPIVVGERARGEGSAVFPRLIVRMGADSEAAVVQHQGTGVGAVFVVPVTELDVGPAARLHFLNLQMLSASATQLGTIVASVEQDATASIGVAGLGGRYSRLQLDCRLEGRGATGNLLAMYYGENEQILDFQTTQDHVAPNTTSRLLVKGALAGRSQAIASGTIRMRPDAGGSSAVQSNHSLKLDEHTRTDSAPRLEIENSDVRCGQTSTVSPIDPDHLFYLESRGIPSEAAEHLIVTGFFADVLDHLPVNAGQEVVAGVVAAKNGRHQRGSASAADEAKDGVS